MVKFALRHINHYRNKTTPIWNFVISFPKYKPQWYHLSLLEQALQKQTYKTNCPISITSGEDQPHQVPHFFTLFSFFLFTDA